MKLPSHARAPWMVTRTLPNIFCNDRKSQFPNLVRIYLKSTAVFFSVYHQQCSTLLVNPPVDKAHQTSTFSYSQRQTCLFRHNSTGATEPTLLGFWLIYAKLATMLLMVNTFDLNHVTVSNWLLFMLYGIHASCNVSSHQWKFPANDQSRHLPSDLLIQFWRGLLVNYMIPTLGQLFHCSSINDK